MPVSKIAPKSYFRTTDFSGGLNTASSPIELEDNESPDCQNVLFDKKGAIQKIRGFSKLQEDEIVVGKGIYGLIPYYRWTDDNGGATKYLIAMCDTKLWNWNGTIWAYIKEGLVAEEYIQGTVWATGDYLIIVKKTNNPQKYNGDSCIDLPGTPPQVQFIVSHVRRIWLAGNATFPNRVYYSDAGDPHIYGVNSYIDMEPIHGDTITGMIVVLDSVVVFTQSCIFVIDTRDSSTPTDWIVKRVSTGVGCEAPHSLSISKENAMFLSDIGIHTLGGVLAKEAYDFDQIKSDLVSDKITDYIKEFNFNEIEKSHGISFDYKLWLSMPYGASETCNRILIYDFTDKWWTRVKGMNASCFVIFKALNVKELYFGSPTTGYVYKYGGCDNFDSAVIEAHHKSKPYDLKYPGMMKRYWRTQVMVGNTGDYNLGVGYALDFDSTYDMRNVSCTKDATLWDVFLWDVDKWDAGKDIIMRPMIMKGERGRFISFMCKNYNADEYFENYGYILQYSQKQYEKMIGE